MPVGAASFREALQLGHRDVPRAEEDPPRPRPVHGRRRRGRLRARPPSNEEAVKVLIEAIEKAGRVARRRDRHRPRSRGERDLQRRLLRPRRRGPHAERAGDGRLLGRPLRPVSDRVDRGRHGRGGLGRLGRADQALSAIACSSSATTCSSPTSSGCSGASTPASANAILVKVNQIGSLTETLETVGLATRSSYAVGDVAPLRRDRGHDDRRPRRRDQLRADQDRRAGAQRPRRQVQPAAPHRARPRRVGRRSGASAALAGRDGDRRSPRRDRLVRRSPRAAASAAPSSWPSSSRACSRRGRTSTSATPSPPRRQAGRPDGGEREAGEPRSTASHTDAEVERIAREQYNLVRPGEEAYAILPGPADPTAGSRRAAASPGRARGSRPVVVGPDGRRPYVLGLGESTVAPRWTVCTTWAGVRATGLST